MTSFNPCNVNVTRSGVYLFIFPLSTYWHWWRLFTLAMSAWHAVVFVCWSPHLFMWYLSVYLHICLCGICLFISTSVYVVSVCWSPHLFTWYLSVDLHICLCGICPLISTSVYVVYVYLHICLCGICLSPHLFTWYQSISTSVYVVSVCWSPHLFTWYLSVDLHICSRGICLLISTPVHVVSVCWSPHLLMWYLSVYISALHILPLTMGSKPCSFKMALSSSWLSTMFTVKGLPGTCSPDQRTLMM